MAKQTIRQAFADAYKKLQKIKINSASLDAELLLSFVLSKPREYILARSDSELTKSQLIKFNKLISQRAQHMPLAYLTHTKEFYGRQFYVDQRVLVPRPETEMIVEQVTSYKLQVTRKIAIVDIGTGNGCIIITLAKELQKYKNIKYYAIDISRNVLTVARKNAKLHGVDKKIKFLRGNLLAPILKNKFVIRHSSFVICANLPYLTPKQIKQSPTIKYEPKLALAAGFDGLKYYRRLAFQLRQFNIKYPDISISLFCEIDPKQNKKIKKIFSFAKKIEIKKDLAGWNRIFIAEF